MSAELRSALNGGGDSQSPPPSNVQSMLELAQRAAVEIDIVPLHVSQNLARAVLLVAALHEPLGKSDDDKVACAGCLKNHLFELWPCPTMREIGRVLDA